MKNRYLVLGVLCAATISVGCGESAADSSAAKGAVSRTSAALSDAASISPLTDFATGGRDVGKSYAVVREQSIAACMRAKGWDYEPILLGVEGAHESTNPSEMTTFRERYGYGLLNNVGVAHRARAGIHKRRAYVESLAPADRERFEADLGVSDEDEGNRAPSGCRAEVDQKLDARFAIRDSALMHDLMAAQESVRSDPSYLEAAQHWIACMKQRGFAYQDADGGHKEVSALFRKGSPSVADRERERAVGAADAHCARTTTWPVQSRLESEKLAQILAQHHLESGS